MNATTATATAAADSASLGRRSRRSSLRASSSRAKCAAGRRRRSEPKPEPASPPAPSLDEFTAQVMSHRSELLASALRLTKNPNDAEDLVQDTLMRAFKSWSSFVPGSNCRAWLFRIMTNSFINDYRRRRRHQKFTNECPDDAVSAFYGPTHQRSRSPRQELLDNSLGDEVTDALSSLTQDYRQVVELADLRGVRYRDIAAKLGVPIGTVMSRLFRARRQLEAKLESFAASDYGIRRASAQPA